MFVLFCALLGLGGQLLRAIIGIYKIHSNPELDLKEHFEFHRFFLGLLVGFLAGALLSLFYKIPLSNTDILGVIAASYAGTDWLEGFMRARSAAVS